MNSKKTWIDLLREVQDDPGPAIILLMVITYCIALLVFVLTAAIATAIKAPME